ncbi:MAG TPA: DUF5667 domain-containing protein [Pseudonocardiaceae bacterium]|nr:DUF5667 domain-containing protein [Pseudonocardiaceae bacterium]
MRATRTSGGPGPDGPEHGQDSFVHTDDVVHTENFARAVDSVFDRGRRSTDPALNRELALVAALRQSGSLIGPTASERDRMRQRIMAEFPSVVHEGNSPVLPLRSSARRTSGRRRHAAIPTEARGRVMVAAAAALCLLMSLSGMSLLLSQDALPGDTLYTFKRSAESAELGLTFGDERKALKHLEFANARVSEIEVLANQADAANNWASGEDRFLRALEDFELDTTAGTRLLTDVAADGQTGILAPLRGWTEEQQARLTSVRGALPLPASTRLDSTLELLDRVVARTVALDRRSACDTVTSGAHDDLGLLPARGACAVAAPSGTSSAVPLPTSEVAPGVGGPTPDGLVPPGLLAPSSDAPLPDIGGEDGPLRLPTSPGDVLPKPGDVGKPLNPVPGGGPAPSILPLPLPGVPLLPLLPLETPHDE